MCKGKKLVGYVALGDCIVDKNYGFDSDSQDRARYMGRRCILCLCSIVAWLNAMASVCGQQGVNAGKARSARIICLETVPKARFHSSTKGVLEFTHLVGFKVLIQNLSLAVVISLNV